MYKVDYDSILQYFMPVHNSLFVIWYDQIHSAIDITTSRKVVITR